MIIAPTNEESVRVGMAALCEIVKRYTRRVEGALRSHQPLNIERFQSFNPCLFLTHFKLQF